MGDELEVEVAAGIAAGGFLRWRRKHALPLGTPCYNCRTPLKGPWCYACGQVGEDFHRSSRKLIWEFLENFFDADSRLWRTLPRLALHPAALTSDYLAGRRAPQVPPLRMFLVVLVLVFVVGQLAAGMGDINLAKIQSDPGDAAKINALHLHIYAPWDEALTAWARAHVGRAMAHPEQLLAAMGAWAHDFAFLALPFSALMLSLIFVLRRDLLLFDHLIFSMHSLSFQGLLVVACLGLQPWGGDEAWKLLFASPVHLFVHMRGVYGTSWLGTLIRMFILFVASSVAFAFLVMGLVLVGLAALKG
jgi:Protein of unknown function (DUF3667)